MTAAMFDEMADQERQLNHNAALLRPGTLLFLWPPGVDPNYSRPTVARVRKARRDMIQAVDIRDKAELQVDVAASDLTDPLRSRWTWEVAAPPERPAVRNGVERIDGSALKLEERIRLICGDVGATVRFGMRDGTSVSGVLGTVIIDDPCALEADWFELVGPTDSRGQVRHWGRVEDIVTVTRVDA